MADQEGADICVSGSGRRRWRRRAQKMATVQGHRVELHAQEVELLQRLRAASVLASLPLETELCAHTVQHREGPLHHGGDLV